MHALQHLRLVTLGVDFEVEDAPVKSRSKSVERSHRDKRAERHPIHMRAPRLAVLASVLGHTVTAHVLTSTSPAVRFFPFGDATGS